MFIRLPGKLKEELKTINVVVTGGGTGGHVYPATAVADTLLEDLDIERVIYIGCPDSLEEKVASERNLDFLPIRISGMPRKFSFNFLKWLYQLNKAVLDALGYLLYTKPDVIFATGGYVSGPVLIAAFILDIPYVIHEGDTHPGIVNKAMSKWASYVSVAFEQAKHLLNGKDIKVLGNPLRSSIGEYTRGEAAIFLDIDPEKKTLLVLGGSQGAKKINDAVIEALPALLTKYDLQIIHQCGEKNYDEIKANLSREIIENHSYIIKGYFEDLAIPLACADFAISRAGSMSLSELMASRVPAILVPYPFAAADHQRNNAKYIVDEGAALYLENDDCNAENIIFNCEMLLKSSDKLDFMRLACNRLARKTAAVDIVKLIKKAGKIQSVETAKQTEDN
ncbi:MAG: undecaprenyldiphospho-muramoylpentapeptide beta-N-acetylglucosaminyltransferase [Cyanobacteriota bacterium]